VSKNEKLANVLLRELENRETLEEYKEIADFMKMSNHGFSSLFTG